MTVPESPTVRTFLWFDNEAEDAARFYVSLLPASTIEGITHFDPDQPPVVVTFTLVGVPYMALNGGPTYKLTEAVSIAVRTADREETDSLWEALLEEGGKESMCGWLVDRFGLSLQITPEPVLRLISADDAAAVNRARQAMFRMRKLNISAVEEAYRGD